MDLHAGREQFATAPDILHALDILMNISENGEFRRPYVINFITELQKGNIYIEPLKR